MSFGKTLRVFNVFCFVVFFRGDALKKKNYRENRKITSPQIITAAQIHINFFFTQKRV